MSIKPPNHTQTPNEIFALIPQMKDAELRITLAIVRATFGWHQGGRAVELSLSDLMAYTGLSRQGVINGLTAGQARGTVYKIKGSKAEKTAYGLVVNEVDQSTKLTSQPSRPKVVNGVDQGSQPGRPRVVNGVDHLTPDAPAPSAEETDPERNRKKIEIKERNTLVADATASTPPQNPEPQNINPTAQGTPGPAQVDHSPGGNGKTHATSTEKVPGGAARPVENPVDNRRHAHPTDYARIIAAWNDHRGNLPEVQQVTEGRKKAVKKLLNDCDGNLEHAIRIVTEATREVALDEFWQARKYGFDNLVPGKVFQRAEAWRSRQGTPGDTPERNASQGLKPSDFMPGQPVTFRALRYVVERVLEDRVVLYDDENGETTVKLNSDYWHGLKPAGATA